LAAILDEIFVRRDLSEWRPILEKAGVTFGAVFSVDEAADDAQAREIGALVPFADGTGLTVSSPFQLEARPRSPRSARPPSASIRRRYCATPATPPTRSRG